MTSRKHAGDSEESPLTESMHLCTGSMDNPSLIKRTVTSSGEHYGSTHSVQSSMALHNMKESGKKYKRRKRIEQVVVIVVAVIISTIIAVGGALIAINVDANRDNAAETVEDTDVETETTSTGTGDDTVGVFPVLSNSTPAQYFPNLEYAVFGYNILNAYPLAFGHDPGITHPIFLVSYGKRKRSADLTYHVPDGLDVVRDAACDTSFSTSVITDQEEFDKALSISAEVSGGGYGVKFSASTQYKKDSKIVSNKENVMLLTQAKCQQFFTQVNEFSPPPLHPSFIGWAKKLEKTTDDRDYLDFIQYYGTHFLSEVAFGARFMYQFVMSTNSYKSMHSKGLNVNAAASFHIFRFGVGATFSFSDSEKEAITKFEEDVTTRTLSLGAPPPLDLNATKWANQAFTNPVPIDYNLLPIDQLFTDKFMGRLSIDYTKVRHRLLHIMNVQYRKEVFDRSSNLQCRVVNHAVKLPESSCFQESFQLMGRKTGPNCHGDCLETQDCLGITYGTDMQEVSQGCHTMYRMSYIENPGLLASHRNETEFKQQQRGCNTYVFPYRQTSNFGLKQPSWLMVNGVTVKKSPDLGTWTKQELEACKTRCAEDIECVAVSSQTVGRDRMCGHFTKSQMDMVTLESSAETNDAMGFIKQCS